MHRGGPQWPRALWVHAENPAAISAVIHFKGYTADTRTPMTASRCAPAHSIIIGPTRVSIARVPEIHSANGIDNLNREPVKPEMRPMKALAVLSCR